MTVDLFQFLIIWGIVLVMFSCVGCLIFGQQKAFNSFWDVLVTYFEASMGNWTLKIYKGED